MNLFKKNLPLMSLMVFLCFSIPCTVLDTKQALGTELNETNISAHLNAQKQALSAISSGVEQLERSCIFSDEQSELSAPLENFAKTKKKNPKNFCANQQITTQNLVICFQPYWIPRTPPPFAGKQGRRNRTQSFLPHRF